MGLKVIFVSGPRRSGKSCLIESMLSELYRKKPPHYLRLAAAKGDKRQPAIAKPPQQCGVNSARWLSYDRDEIYEVLPQALTRIHSEDRYGTVLIEADADPDLRNVYPYDRRVFVMRAPQALTEVFRTAREAAEALKDVLDDTAAFAREIYGMVENSPADTGTHEMRPKLTLAQMRGFLSSPLGEELATRIQFQPDYHGLVESDLILINCGAGDPSELVDECVERLERLLARLRGPASREPLIYCCDPLDGRDSLRKKLFKSLRDLLTVSDY